MNPTLVLSDSETDGTFKVRRARKRWICRTTGDGKLRGWDAGPLPAGHTQVIQPGTLHVEYLGETSAYKSGIRYCAACAHAAGVAVYSLGTMPE